MSQFASGQGLARVRCILQFKGSLSLWESVFRRPFNAGPGS
jgi:hypothetical protein